MREVLNIFDSCMCCLRGKWIAAQIKLRQPSNLEVDEEEMEICGPTHEPDQAKKGPSGMQQQYEDMLLSIQPLIQMGLAAGWTGLRSVELAGLCQKEMMRLWGYEGLHIEKCEDFEQGTWST